MVDHCTFHKGRNPGYITFLFYQCRAKHVTLCKWLSRTSPKTFLCFVTIHKTQALQRLNACYPQRLTDVALISTTSTKINPLITHLTF
jgi:hypothetical protein